MRCSSEVVPLFHLVCTGQPSQHSSSNERVHENMCSTYLASVGSTARQDGGRKCHELEPLMKFEGPHPAWVTSRHVRTQTTKGERGGDLKKSKRDTQRETGGTFSTLFDAQVSE